MKNFFDQKRVANKREKKKFLDIRNLLYIAATSLYIILLTKETKKIKEKCKQVICGFCTERKYLRITLS